MSDDFVKGLSSLPRHHLHWSAANPNGRVPVEQVQDWPVMSLDAFKAFKKFTGLRFLPETYLHRKPGGSRIFAVNSCSSSAVCVYNHTRTFGE